MFHYLARRSTLVYAAVSSMILSGAALAADPMPAPGELNLGGGITGHALVNMYYEFNFNRPPISESPATATQNNFRAYDRAHNQFQISNVYLGLSKDADPVGFIAMVGFGPQLDVLTLTTPADTTVDRTNAFIRNAAITWKKNWFGLELGRIDADFGFEAIDQVNNWNYSHSLQFALLQPKFLTGVNTVAKADSGVYAELGLFNGVDRFTDNNKGKTGALKLGYDGKKTDGGLSYTFGPEADANSGNWRHTLNLHARHMFRERTGLGLDATYNVEQNATTTAAGLRSTAKSYGAGLYGGLGFCDDHMATLRLEWLHDRDGAATLRGREIDVYAFTLTHRYWATKNFSLWSELRLDNSDKSVFSDSDGAAAEKNQFTALVAATFQI